MLTKTNIQSYNYKPFEVLRERFIKMLIHLKLDINIATEKMSRNKKMYRVNLDIFKQKTVNSIHLTANFR